MLTNKRLGSADGTPTGAGGAGSPACSNMTRTLDFPDSWPSELVKDGIPAVADTVAQSILEAFNGLSA